MSQVYLSLLSLFSPDIITCECNKKKPNTFEQSTQKDCIFSTAVSATAALMESVHGEQKLHVADFRCVKYLIKHIFNT